jgi:hypothetical protein
VAGNFRPVTIPRTVILSLLGLLAAGALAAFGVILRGR